MVNRILFVDNSIRNSDWTKANAFDFPDVKTVEDFENSFNIPKEEPARSEKLARLAVLPWVRVAPAPVRELLEGFKKQSLIELVKASFGGDRSEAGRYAANIRWQGNRKTLKVDDANSVAVLRQAYERAEPNTRRLGKELLERLTPEVIKNAYLAYMTISGEAEVYEKYVPDSDWRNKSLDEMIDKISGQTIGQYVGFKDDDGNMEQDRPMVRLLQVAVAEKFGLQEAGGNPSNKGSKENYETASELAKNPDLMKVMTTLVDLVYEETQKTLKEAGITHIECERGTKNDALASEIADGGKATIMLRPVSSWTLDSSTAEMFAQPKDWQRRQSAGVIVKVTVPIEKVFAFGAFRFGRVEEDEILLLGGSAEVTGRLNTIEPPPPFVPFDREAFLAKLEALKVGKARDAKPIFLDDEEGNWIGVVRLMRSGNLSKASFGGDRSEAGRYAANIRWQGHAKGSSKGSKFTSKKDDEKFRKKYGNERPVGDGDCFQSAVKVMFEVLTPEQRKNAKICHGVPMGQGRIEGIRFDHAWVEVTTKTDFGDADPNDPQVKLLMERFPTQTVVYDYSNGRELQIPKELYYAIGQIDEESVKRFSAKQAQVEMTERGFYGPWE